MATQQFIGDIPADRVIRITKDCDRIVNFRLIDADGNPKIWGTQRSVYIEIDVSKTQSARVDATIITDLATVRLESDVLNQVGNNSGWRAIISDAALSPSLETPICIGTFERHDS
jgi:hypothetical protein